MIQLFQNTTTKPSQAIDKAGLFSICYHNIFDYPLSFSESIKWKANPAKLTDYNLSVETTSKSGFHMLEGREGLVYKRELKRRISKRKMAIAKKAAAVLSFIPTIKMVAVTGSLAMENATETSDVDLMIVAQKGALWSSRLLAHLLLSALQLPIRIPKDRDEKDKLCMNIWLDESDMSWQKKNFFTAHEVAQVKPLVNRDETYEKFICQNKWVIQFWPNSIKSIKRLSNQEIKNNSFFLITVFLEPLARGFQFLYMKNKITRETITSTRALFHPVDWSKQVLSRLELFKN